MMNITSGRFVASDVEMFGEQRAGIRGFDFLVNAVWPEVVSLIEVRFGSIFAPGNPDAFHQVSNLLKRRYFMLNFKAQFRCSSAVQLNSGIEFNKSTAEVQHLNQT